MEAGQGNPTGVPRAGKRANTRSLPHLGVPQKHQGNSHKISTEDLVKIPVEAMRVSSVSVSLCEPV